MKLVQFNAQTQLVDVTALETLTLPELKAIAESANIGHNNATAKVLIQKIKIHFNQYDLLSQRLLAMLQNQVREEKAITLDETEYSQFLAFKNKQKSNATTGNVTTVPYTHLPIGTIVSKNGTLLLVAEHPAPGVTMLASNKLAWRNTNQAVTGLGSAIIVEGTGMLPDTFNNPEYDACLNKAKALIRDNKVKQAKADLKRISDANNMGNLSDRYFRLLSLLADKVTPSTLDIISGLAIGEEIPEVVTRQMELV